jgi:pyruvate/2-oxoglutarate dehydrogenase complex dihydrolipoamide acyltransferase (E2) component
MIRLVRVVRLVPVGVLAMLLAACGGSGPAPQELPALDAAASAEPAPEPSASATPSASPTETASAAPGAAVTAVPEASDVPAAARKNTPNGGRLFAEHYLEAYNAAQESGDTEPLSALATPGCASCRGFIESIRDVYDAGGTVEGGLITVLNSSAPTRKIDGRQIVLIEVRVSKERDFDKDGREIESYPGEKSQYYFYLVREDERWLVDAIQRVTR